MSATAANGSRASKASPLRRTTQYVLASGIVLSIAAAFGPIWVVRVGVAVAVIAAILAVRFAWKELRQRETEHGREMLDSARRQGQALAAERQQTGSVLEAMKGHNESAHEQINKLQGEIGELRAELNSLRGANASLKADLIERDHQVKQLRRDLATREAELRQLQELDDQAEVLAMPRHVAGTDFDALPSADELWSDGDHPTIVDLQQMVFPKTEQAERKQA